MIRFVDLIRYKILNSYIFLLIYPYFTKNIYNGVGASQSNLMMSYSREREVILALKISYVIYERPLKNDNGFVSSQYYCTNLLVLNFTDTEPLYTKAIQNIVGKYGKTFTWEIKAKMMGLNREEGSKFIIKELDLPLKWEEYDLLAQKEYALCLSEPDIIPGK